MLQCVLPNKRANLSMKAYSKHKVYLIYVVHNEIYLVYLMYMSQVFYGNLLNSMVHCHCILRNPVQQAVECI